MYPIGPDQALVLLQVEQGRQSRLDRDQEPFLQLLVKEAKKVRKYKILVVFFANAMVTIARILSINDKSKDGFSGQTVSSGAPSIQSVRRGHSTRIIYIKLYI